MSKTFLIESQVVIKRLQSDVDRAEEWAKNSPYNYTFIQNWNKPSPISRTVRKVKLDWMEGYEEPQELGINITVADGSTQQINALPSLLTIPVVKCFWKELWHDLCRNNIFPADIQGLNGAAIPREGVSKDLIVTSISVKKLINVVQILKVLEYRVEPISAHRLLANSDMFIKATIFPTIKSRHHGIVCFPDHSDLAKQWTALRCGQGLPDHIVKYLAQKPDGSDLTKEIKELEEYHSRQFNSETGIGRLGPIAPGLFDSYDCWMGPSLTMSRFFNQNEQFKASDVQAERYKNSKSISFNHKGNSTEESKQFRIRDHLPSPSVFLSYRDDDLVFDNKNDVAKHHRTRVFRYRMKYLHETALALNEGLLDLYRNQVNQEVTAVMDRKLHHLVRESNSRNDEKINILTQRTDQLEDNQEMIGTKVLLNEHRTKILEKENALTNARIVAIDPETATNPDDVAIKSMVMNPAHFKSESDTLKTERDKLKELEENVDSGATFSFNLFPKLSKGNTKLSLPTLKLTKPPLTSLQFTHLPTGKLKQLELGISEKMDGNQPIVPTNTADAKRKIQVRATSIPNPDPADVVECLLPSSDDDSSPQSLSRNSLGALNLPFSKILNESVKPNFHERRAAFKRRYAFELVLTPYLKNKFEMAIILYLNEIYIILDKILSYDNPKWAQTKQIVEETKFVREQFNSFDFGIDFLRKYICGDCKNFTTPMITVELLSFIFSIFDQSKLLIPYVGVPDRKAFLQRLFQDLDPMYASNFVFSVFLQSDCTSASSIESSSDDNDPEHPRMNPNDSNFSSLHPKQIMPKNVDQAANGLSPPLPILNKIQKIRIPDQNPRYDSEVVDAQINQFSDSPTSGVNNIHDLDTDRVKAYDAECKCNDCLKITNATPVISDSAYLLPPSQSILDTIVLKKKTDPRYEYYLRNKTIPTKSEIDNLHNFSKKKIARLANSIERRKGHLLHVKSKLKSKAKDKTKTKTKKLSQTSSEQARMTVITPTKSNNLSILYTNLNRPLIQISKITENESLCCDILCFSELRMDPVHIRNKTLFGNNWEYFHHEPVLIKQGYEIKPMIFSLILINTDSGLSGVKKATRAPFTSVAISAITNNDEVFTFNVAVAYRTHYESHRANIALKIYTKNDNNTKARYLHNEFYRKQFCSITEKYQMKVPSIFCGDLNMDFQNPRETDNNDLCRSIQAVFAPYIIHSQKPTHFTHSRQAKNGVVKSRIDFFVTKNFPTDFKQVNQISGYGALNDGHSILMIESNLEKVVKDNKIIRTVRVLKSREALFHVSKRAYYHNHDKLEQLYKSVINHTDQGLSYKHTNPYTSYLVSLLDDILDAVSYDKTIEINVSNPKFEYSDYSARLLEKIEVLNNKKVLSESDVVSYGVYKNILKMSVIENSRKSFKPYVNQSELSTNDIFALNRFYNPKSKLSVGKCGNHTPDQLLNIYLETVDARKNLPINPDVDLWPDLKNKFSIDDLSFNWEGTNRGNSIKKCLQSCQPFAKGLDSDLTKHALGFYCAEFAKLFVWMQEANVKCGRAPDFCRRSRLRQIPKLSAIDLTLDNARRFIAVSGVTDTYGEKNVCYGMNEVLENEKALPDWQNAFRKNRSTSTALADILLRIQKLPRSHSKILLMFDSSNAFGVSSPILLRKVIDSISKGCVNKYLKSLLEQKTVVVEDKGMRSRAHTLPHDAPGVPQGKSTSPTLFALLISALQKFFPDADTTFLSAFADDLSMVISRATIDECIEEAKKAIKTVEEFLTGIGIRVNISKSSFMVFGPGSNLPFDLFYKGEKLKRVEKTKLLGLRFTNQLSMKPQHDWLISNRFPKHRGAINVLMYAKSRINLLNLVNSLYFGQFNFSAEVWPRMDEHQSNRIAAEMTKVILDIYGLPIVRSNQKKYSYMELFTMTGLPSPINVQDRSILNFASSILSSKNPNEQLLETLLNSIKFHSKNHIFDYNHFTLYQKRVLMSLRLLKIHILLPKHIITFPGNMKKPLKNLPHDVGAHFGNKYKSFNRICKIHFKYKCPHRDGLSPTQCKNCIEKQKIKTYVCKYLPSTAYRRFSIFYYANTFSIYNLPLREHINSTIINVALKLASVDEPL